MDFKTYWKNLPAEARETFADNSGTTVGYCHQIVYGGKSIELGLADAMVAQSGGALTLEELPLTEKAQFHNEARKAKPATTEQGAA